MPSIRILCSCRKVWRRGQSHIYLVGPSSAKAYPLEMQARRSGEIVLDDDDPLLIGYMFKYLYTLDYSLEHVNGTFNPNSVDITPDQDDNVTNGNPAAATPPPSILAGLVVNSEGKVVNEHGIAVGELIDGDPYRISRFQYTCNAAGQVINVVGRIIGQARTLPAKQRSQSAQSHASLVLHPLMYALGEKFGIAGLRALAREKFAAACATGWNNADFVEAIQVVYNATTDKDRELRQIILTTILSHLELLRKPAIETAMYKCNGLAFELLKLQHS